MAYYTTNSYINKGLINGLFHSPCEVVASSNVIDRQMLASSRRVELELIFEEVIIRVKVFL